MATWIDFKALRSQLRFADVLRHYHIDAKIKGDRAYAFCPLPGHPVRSDGQKRTASLSINLSRNIFQCFGCKQSGNALEFVARMEGFDPGDPAQFREAALKIAELFGLSERRVSNVERGLSKDKEEGRQASQASTFDHRPSTIETIVNAPLDFELKHLDPKHAYLLERGFTPETIEHFGLGFCSKGLMKDRIAIPLHDATGQLIGYAGRLVDDQKVSDDCQKYLFPGP